MAQACDGQLDDLVAVATCGIGGARRAQVSGAARGWAAMRMARLSGDRSAKAHRSVRFIFHAPSPQAWKPVLR